MTVARPSFLFDVNRCTGCQACELACEIANGTTAGLGWRRVRTFNPLHVAGVELAHLSLACNHCDAAPCKEQCPSGAYGRDAGTGAVLIDADACVGCRYCAWVCPYDAPTFDESRGVMTKCTFCVDRQHLGRGPACTESCPTGALSWAVIEPAAWTPHPSVPGFADAGARPAVVITDLHDRRRVPECTHPPAMPPWRTLWSRLTPHIGVVHEWPLVLFTWLLALLVGWTVAGVCGGMRPPWWLITGAGGGGLLLSAAHLGRRERAWRAIIHIGSSRLSREIVLAGAFMMTAAIWVWRASASSLTGTVVGVLGFVLLWTVDAVYRPGRIRGVRLQHSAAVLETGLFFGALFALHWPLLWLIAAGKIGLYLDRKRRRTSLGLSTRPAATMLRCGLLGGGLGVLAVQGAGVFSYAAAVLMAAELIDRAEFYDEIEIPTPDTLMLLEMERRCSSPSAAGDTFASS